MVNFVKFQLKYSVKSHDFQIISLKNIKLDVILEAKYEKQV